MVTKFHTVQKLTNTFVKAAKLPEDKDSATCWDSALPGFGLRLHGGHRSWIVRYRTYLGVQRQMKLGGWPGMKAETVRRKAQEMLGFRATGGDPVQERREAKRREAATVGRALDEYHAQRERRGLVKVEQERVALAAALASWRGRDLADIDRRAIVETLKRIADDPKRGPGASAYTRKTLHTFLDWSVSEGLIPANPIAGMRQPRASRAEMLQKRRSAGRALSEVELRHIWSGLDFNRVYDRLVGFVLLTGVRRSEAGALEWSWINDNAEIINIPAPITKSGRDHVVILTKVLRELLDQCPPRTGPLVFPSVRTVRKIEGWSKLQPELCVRVGIEFVLHDLRRSLLTHARKLGADSDLAGLLVGHKRPDLESVYDHSRLLERRKQIAQAYAAMVTYPSGGANVVPLAVHGTT